MTVTYIVGCCIVAFGIGYGGGSLIRIARKAVESID